LNVRINLSGLENDAEPADILADLVQLEREAALAEKSVECSLKNRAGLSAAAL